MTDIPFSEAQKSRITYLLRLACPKAGFGDSTCAQIITRLAPQLSEVLTEEGFYLESRQHINDMIAEIESAVHED